MKGKLIIISAPSGAGKTSIVREVIKQSGELEFSVSATTRKARKGEVNGKDYYFLSLGEFKYYIENDAFVEYEQVYTNQFYGTLKSELTRIWSKGHHVIFDVDVIGGLNIKKQYPENSLALFIMPPSVEELEKRLFARAKDDDRSIRQRLSKAKHEITYAHQFDNVIVNENLEQAINETLGVMKKFLGT
ncbi:MAG: guanylate kinase [Bacteroidales bacterium]